VQRRRDDVFVQIRHERFSPSSAPSSEVQLQRHPHLPRRVALATALRFENALAASGVALGSPGGFADAQGSNQGDDLPYLAPRAAICRHRGSRDALGDDLEERFVGVAAAESAQSQVGTARPTGSVRTVAGGALAPEQARAFRLIGWTVERVGARHAVLAVKRQYGYASSEAAMVILAFSRRDIGQPALALPAALSKAS
jgi:hypothetical protein